MLLLIILVRNPLDVKMYTGVKKEPIQALFLSLGSVPFILKFLGSWKFYLLTAWSLQRMIFATTMTVRCTFYIILSRHAIDITDILNGCLVGDERDIDMQLAVQHKKSVITKGGNAGSELAMSNSSAAFCKAFSRGCCLRVFVCNGN